MADKKEGVNHPADGPEEAAIRKIDAKLEEAVNGRDLVTLGKMFADDYTYTHSSGLHQTKVQHLKTVDGYTDFTMRDIMADDIEVHGEIAVVQGHTKLAKTGDAHPHCRRWIRVYRRKDGGWQAVSTRVVPADDMQDVPTSVAQTKVPAAH